MRSTIFLALSAFVVSALADTPAGTVTVVWRADDTGDSIQEYQIKATGACREIPNSNAMGDKGSWVWWSNDPKFCFTMYTQHNCYEPMLDKNGKQVAYTERAPNFDPGPGKIARSYRVWDRGFTDGVQCDSTTFNWIDSAAGSHDIEK